MSEQMRVAKAIPKYEAVPNTNRSMRYCLSEIFRLFKIHFIPYNVDYRSGDDTDTIYELEREQLKLLVEHLETQDSTYETHSQKLGSILSYYSFSMERVISILHFVITNSDPIDDWVLINWF